MDNLTSDTRSIVIEREIPHPPEKIWRALTQGPLIGQWLMSNDFQAIVGHRFSFRAACQPHWNGLTDCQDLVVELTRLATGSRDRRADDHAHGPRLLHPSAARPIEPGVVCDRHDEPAGLNGEQRAAHAVATRLAGGHARALREDHDPVALV